MAFVVETGDGLPNSNGYITESFFLEYHTDRGRDLTDPATGSQWTTSQIESAIIVASDFLDAKFQFIGIRETVTQSMDWPRSNACYQDGRIADGVPPEVAEATAELAFRQLSEDIAPDPGYDSSNRLIGRKREHVGPIQEETEFTRGGHPIDFRAYPFAERRMRELIVTGRFLERV